MTRTRRWLSEMCWYRARSSSMRTWSWRSENSTCSLSVEVQIRWRGEGLGGEILTRSSSPRTSFKTFVSETTMPFPSFRTTSNTANMSLRCGRWVQIILACGLGLVQCENLNKGRATGPCVAVDAVDTDEGAMSDAAIAAPACAGEGRSQHRPFNDKVIKVANLCNASFLRCAMRNHDGICCYISEKRIESNFA